MGAEELGAEDAPPSPFSAPLSSTCAEGEVGVAGVVVVFEGEASCCCCCCWRGVTGRGEDRELLAFNPDEFTSPERGVAAWMACDSATCVKRQVPKLVRSRGFNW